VAVSEREQRATGAGATLPWLQAPPPPPLNEAEDRAITAVRRLGIVGALFLAIGSLGAGAAPVINPVFEIPVLRLFARIPTVSLAICFAGMAMMVLAWLLYGRYVRPGRPRMASTRQTNRTTMMWIVPLLATTELRLGTQRVAFLLETSTALVTAPEVAVTARTNSVAGRRRGARRLDGPGHRARHGPPLRRGDR
jgi:hypothetical protein